MRVGGVLPHPVPEPADQVWKAAAQTPLPPHSLRLRHRAALLRQARRQDPHRDLDTGHAVVRLKLPVAVDVDGGLQHVTQRLAEAGVGHLRLMSAPFVAKCTTTQAKISQPGTQV